MPSLCHPPIHRLHANTAVLSQLGGRDRAVPYKEHCAKGHISFCDVHALAVLHTYRQRKPERQFPMSAHLYNLASMDTLAKRIAQARAEAKLSQSELARRVGVSSQTVNRWERADLVADNRKAVRPSRESIIALATALGKPVQWLLSGHAPSIYSSEYVESKWGREVAYCAPSKAIHSIDHDGTKPILISRFQSGPRSFYFEVTDNSLTPLFPVGSLLIMDPDKKPSPGATILASYGQEPQPIIGILSYASAPGQQITIVTPHNPAWASARSDIARLEVIACLTEATIAV